MTARLVIIESPYSGPDKIRTDVNVQYAELALLDSLAKGEAPYASHLLYTRVLDDTVKEERRQGIDAGFAWGQVAELRAFYIDRGMSKGMIEGLKEARRLKQLVVFRSFNRSDLYVVNNNCSLKLGVEFPAHTLPE